MYDNIEYVMNCYLYTYSIKDSNATALLIEVLQTAAAICVLMIQYKQPQLPPRHQQDPV